MLRECLTLCDRSVRANGGDRPALKTAPVFGGIAGIMSGEQGEAEDAGRRSPWLLFDITLLTQSDMSALNSNARETGEVQDMYRRNLAAYMTAQPGELKADECIEDIFNGGDGWGSKGPDGDGRSKFDHPEIKSRYSHAHRRSGSAESLMSGQTTPRAHVRHKSHHSRGISGRASLEQHANNMKAEAANNPIKASTEANEFDLREDLRSWKMPDFAT